MGGSERQLHIEDERGMVWHESQGREVALSIEEGQTVPAEQEVEGPNVPL